LELLTQVVAMNGEFRWAARNEQAAIERRLGKSQDAQALYDEVLKGDARAAEKREALCGKADIFFEQANANAANLDRAVGIYDQLANEAANQPHWRNQALFKKGVCLEKESDRDGALATFYRILEFNPSPDRPPEFFWFYKADLMRRDYWRSNKNGKQRRRFTKNWWRPMDRAVRKRARAWGSCGWSIFFGNKGAKNRSDCRCIMPKTAR
jgi:tetratricopeptide (TPR) repeat protein